MFNLWLSKWCMNIVNFDYKFTREIDFRFLEIGQLVVVAVHAIPFIGTK